MKRGKPLKPGKPLKRGKGLKRGSRLKRGNRLKAKHWSEKDGCYGPLWEAVKRLPCWGRRWVPGHRCWGRHTAHHEPPVSKGGTDESGLIPTCELLHGILDQRSLGETRRDLLDRIDRDEAWLAELAEQYVEGADPEAVSGSLAF